MHISVLCTLFVSSILAVVHASPVARDNDGSRPITWISPEGNQRCWQVDNGNLRANEVLVVQVVSSESRTLSDMQHAVHLVLTAMDPMLNASYITTVPPPSKSPAPASASSSALDSASMEDPYAFRTVDKTAHQVNGCLSPTTIILLCRTGLVNAPTLPMAVNRRSCRAGDAPRTASTK